MAYTDYDFYRTVFFGDILTPANANKWLSRASDEIDHFTFNRLQDNFPEIEHHKIKILKAVCAIADLLCKVEEQREAVAIKADDNGNIHGAISSISSGRESIGYVSNGSSASIYARAAASAEDQRKAVEDIIYKYLSDIPDSKGINLLYAGVDRNVPGYGYFI